MDKISFDKVLIRIPSLPLERCFERPEVMPDNFLSSVYLSSKELFHQFKLDVQNEKFYSVLNKYWIRSSTRCTPYAWFAGLAVASVRDSKTVIKMANSHSLVSRLDMDFLWGIIEKIISLEDYGKRVVSITDSLYETPTDFRYVEYEIVDGKRKYRQCSVEKTDSLIFVIQKTQSEISLVDLATELARELDVTEEDAIAYLDILFKAQILVSDLFPPLTINNQLNYVIDKLEKKYGESHTWPIIFVEIRNKLKYNPSIEQFIEIENQILKEFGDEVKVKNSFQGDLFINLKEAEIEDGIITTITDDLKKLQNLFGKKSSSSSSEMNAFKKAVRQRFGDKIVPLSYALDTDWGVSYGIDDGGRKKILTDGFNLEVNNDSSKSNEKLVLKKYIDYIQNGHSLIELRDDDFSQRKLNEELNFPSSQYAIGTLMKKEGKIDKHNFVFDLSFVGGPSAANLMGRFAYGSQEIYDFIQQLIKIEEQSIPDAIFAEIVHLPQSRTGNVLLRPSLRHYELPYLGKSGLPKEYQIPVNDLHIQIKDEKVLIFSKKLNKRVIPRLSTAHNFLSSEIPVYKFLCDAQNDGFAQSTFWDWGELNFLPFLPRVVIKI